MKIAPDMTALVGNTPLVELSRYGEMHGVARRLVAKVEMVNPGGSVKARTALAMIEEAEKRGAIHPGSTIIEPTSATWA